MIKTTSYSKQDSKLQKHKFLNIKFTVIEQAIQILKVLMYAKLRHSEHILGQIFFLSSQVWLLQEEWPFTFKTNRHFSQNDL